MSCSTALVSVTLKQLEKQQSGPGGPIVTPGCRVSTVLCAQSSLSDRVSDRCRHPRGFETGAAAPKKRANLASGRVLGGRDDPGERLGCERRVLRRYRSEKALSERNCGATSRQSSRCAFGELPVALDGYTRPGRSQRGAARVTLSCSSPWRGRRPTRRTLVV